MKNIQITFRHYDKTTTGGFPVVAEVAKGEGVFFHPIQSVNGRALIGKELSEGLKGKGGILAECENDETTIRAYLTAAHT